MDLKKKKEIKKYHVKKTVYTDIYGDVIFEESTMIFRRLHAIDETFTENFVRYKVRRVALYNDMQIVNVVEI